MGFVPQPYRISSTTNYTLGFKLIGEKLGWQGPGKKKKSYWKLKQ